MQVKKLQISNFKNLQELTVELKTQAGITILIGENGQGKTNLLEAIWLLSLPKPLRTRSLTDCINFDATACRVQAICTGGTFEELSLATQKQPQKTKYTLDYGETKLIDWLGRLQVVLFTPDDIRIVTGEPRLRRQYINQLLSRTDREYFWQLRKYTYCLRQRNALLKKERIQGSSPELDSQRRAWEQQLVESMAMLLTARVACLQELAVLVTENYQKLAASEETVAVHWQGVAAQFPEAEPELLTQALHQVLPQEKRRGTTQFGPHTDDIEFLLADKPAKITASRGEVRSLVLALKLAEITYIEKHTNTKPVLLLDDVFSELDQNRRQSLLEIASAYQTVITTVEESYFLGSQAVVEVKTIAAGQIR